MRVLQSVTATPEQVALFQHRLMRGPIIVRGAAGSGKTTTALLRLNHLHAFWTQALAAQGRAPHVLVLTFNRTLRGYVSELAAQQAYGASSIEIDTFGMWAKRRLLDPPIADATSRKAMLSRLATAAGLPHDPQFIVDEVSYVLGRLMPDDLDTYPTQAFRRDGRGTVPQFTRVDRNTLLQEVIRPYAEWKATRRFSDWNDLAVQLASNPMSPRYDIVVLDETQDFTANNVRAILAHLEDRSSVTFVLDAAQRIYPNFFRWNEVGVDANPLTNVFRLTKNHRNTREIAAFAKPLVEGLNLGDDASLPDLDSCEQSGSTPVVLRGSYSAQVRWALDYVDREVDLAKETVAFLHAKGGGWFDYLRDRLRSNGKLWVELAREREWPDGPVNIGLSTMHSAKGLEFDHVLILGLNDEAIDCGDDPNHDSLEAARRLVAMSITRGRRFVAIGYKASDEPAVATYLDPATYCREDL